MMEQTITPPPAALAYLRANPQKADQFDAKYGAGLAQQFLMDPTASIAVIQSQAPTTGPEPGAPAEAQSEPSAVQGQAAGASAPAALPQPAEDGAEPAGGRPWFSGGITGPVSDLVGGAIGGAVKAIGAIPGGIQALSKLDPFGPSFPAGSGADQFPARVEAASDVVADAVTPDSTLADISSGISQFAVSFLGAGKILAPLGGGAMSPLVAATVKGAMADFFGADGHSGNLADFMIGLGIDHPITQWLSTAGDDGDQLEARAKNALLGIGFGLGIEGTMQSFRLLRKWMHYPAGDKPTTMWDNAQKAGAARAESKRYAESLAADDFTADITARREAYMKEHGAEFDRLWRQQMQLEEMADDVAAGKGGTPVDPTREVIPERPLTQEDAFQAMEADRQAAKAAEAAAAAKEADDLAHPGVPIGDPGLPVKPLTEKQIREALKEAFPNAAPIPETNVKVKKRK